MKDIIKDKGRKPHLFNCGGIRGGKTLALIANSLMSLPLGEELTICCFNRKHSKITANNLKIILPNAIIKRKHVKNIGGVSTGYSDVVTVRFTEWFKVIDMNNRLKASFSRTLFDDESK